ncbi:MAG: Peptidase family [Bacteroidetes bacterium]|nr:Peptidase family [Bacteroidota bacterium]
MKTYLALCVLLLTAVVAYPQSSFNTDYEPLRSKGQLPKDFTTLSSDKYASERVHLKGEKGKNKTTKDQFILESSFQIDDMLLSGKVLFNDPMTQYVNNVATKVLDRDKDTRAKLRFYILKSPSVNAFATNQGIVFVTMGMLAQLENEAQLSYVISHEVIHYKSKHAINRAVEAEKIERGKGTYKSFSKDEKYIASCSFTKEQEAEADEKGFDIFKNTDYSSAHLIGVFDVLKYSYLPFDDISFDKSLFENSSYRIPKSLMPDETTPINTKDDEENLKSTHPSIKSRRAAIEAKIANVDNSGKSDYLVSKDQFELMRETARFELSRLYMLRHDYEAAIYNSYMLLRKYPDNLYLKKSILASLSGLAGYAGSSDFDKVHTSYKEVEGKSEAINYLIQKMDSSRSADIKVLAMAYAAKLKKQYPKDRDIDEETKYIIDLLVASDVKLDYFSDVAPPAHILSGDTQRAAVDTVHAAPADSSSRAAIRDTVNESGSKYEKIKNQLVVKKEEIKQGKGYYAQYALVEYMKDPWLSKYFSEAETAQKKEDAEDLVIHRRSTVSSKVYELGIDRVLIINPYYARINADISKKKSKNKYLQSEGGQIDFSQRLALNARKAKLDIEVLDSKKLGASEVEKMNDIAELEEYVSERLSSPFDTRAIYPERERIAAMAKKYNTDYFLWTGVVSYEEFRKSTIGLAVTSALLPVILPFTLSPLINRGHYTFYFNIMYDVKTDRIKMVNFREVNNKTGPSILNSHIFDTFEQMHTAPSAKTKEK